MDENSEFNILDAIPFPCFLLSEEGKIIHVNQTLSKTFELEKTSQMELFYETLPSTSKIQLNEASSNAQVCGNPIFIESVRFGGNAKRIRNFDLCVAKNTINNKTYSVITLINESTSSKISDLQEANRKIDEFTKSARHDLKEPIRNISSFVEFIKEEIGNSKSENSGEVFYMLDTISGCCTRMEKLVTNLLSFSRSDTRRLEKVRTSLNTSLDKALYELNTKVKVGAAQIDYHSLPEVEVDGDLMKEVFYQLIDNSLKYTSSSIPHIQIFARVDGNEHCIYIQDNGVGIDDEYQLIAFDPFKRLSNDHRNQSSGMGLTICKKIIERHHGSISIDPEYTEGTRIEIRLPQPQTELALRG